ncbi:MAG: hypothetical protein ABIS47_02830 [Acidimicrobiales bacterium]
MPDASDAAIRRQVLLVVAAAIFCLLCGGIAGIFVVRDDYRGSGNQQVNLAPASPG